MNKSESLTSALAASSSKGVQKLYTKLRHKIGDNFITHHHSSSGSSSKRGKAAKTNANDIAVLTVSAASALSDVSKVPNGERFISETNFKRTQGMLKHQRISNKARNCKVTTTKSASPPPATATSLLSTLHNTAQDAANKSVSPATTTTVAAAVKTSIYIDSDDEYPFNVTTKSSLEDEIFEELEKVAHDENKLHAVLKNFDNILSEYNNSCLATTKSTSSDKNCDKKDVATQKEKAKPQLQTVSPSRQEMLKVVATECRRISRMNAQLKIVKMPKLKNWKSCSNILEKCKHFSERSPTGRYKSLENVSADVKHAEADASNQFKKSLHVPSTTNAPTKKNLNLAQKLLNVKKVAAAPRLQSKSTLDLAAAGFASSKIPINKTAALRKRSASLCDFNLLNSSDKQPIHHPLRMRRNTPNNSQPPPPPQRPFPNANKTLKINTVPTTRRKVISSKMQQQSNNTTATEKKPLMRNVTKKSPASMATTQMSRQNSDILLEKCLEKGHEILRKVEAMQADVATVNNNKKHSTSANLLIPLKKSKSFTRPKKPKPLNYADDQQMDSPQLEYCKIIPPIIGETSPANAKLLVNVVQIKANIVQKQYDVLDCKNIQPTSSSSSSTCTSHYPTEKIIDIDSDDSGHISNDIDNDSYQSQLSNIEAGGCGGLVGGSKIAKLLRKFENPTKDITTFSTIAPKTIVSNNNKPGITTVKVAKLEPIKCIHTQVEIYPNYSKEVTIRLL